MHSSADLNQWLTKAVRKNNINAARDLLRDGADPLYFVTVEAVREKEVTKYWIPDNIIKIPFDAPLFFLARSIEMKELIFSFIVSRVVNGDIKNMDNNNIQDMEHLHYFLLKQMNEHSRGLLISFLVMNNSSNLPTSISQLGLLKSFLENLVSFLNLNVGYDTVDNFEINLSIIKFIMKCSSDRRYMKESAIKIIDDILKLLFQSSTDLQQPINVASNHIPYSPLTFLLDEYGGKLIGKKSADPHFLQLMLNSNYILWKDARNDNIDVSFNFQHPDYRNYKSNLSAALKPFFELSRSLGFAKYFELLNICQMFSFMSWDENNSYWLPTELRREILKIILSLKLESPLNSLDDVKTLRKRIDNQIIIAEENAELKKEMEFFIGIYNVLRAEKFFSSAHTFIEDQQGYRPRKFFQRAESHARKNPDGLTAQALTKTKQHKEGLFASRKELKETEEKSKGSKPRQTKK